MLKKLILQLKNTIRPLRSTNKNNSFKSEDDYYEYLFTKSGYYSSRNLNSEEQIRFKHISRLVEKAIELNNGQHFREIVDYGCGRGWLSNELLKYGHVIGIEPVKPVVEYGKRLFQNLDLRNGKIDLLENLSPSLIVCSEVIEHIARHEQSLYFEAFRKALENSKGFLIVTTPRKECFPEWSKYLDPSQPVEDWLSEDELRNYAEKAGFTVVDKLTYFDRPSETADLMEVYQQWLFRA
jgi:2-polyprenyl-3-methyl-5-hydroxy-6-metoxy-1,4-benzoquinol methylase